MTRGHSGWMALPDAPHPRNLTDEQWNFIGPCLPKLCTPWRRADRSAPEDRETADARRSPAASLPTEVEGRATFCLAPELSADRVL